MKADIQPFGNELVRLRLLGEADLPITLAWRNRDSARRWFKTHDLLNAQQHMEWYRRYLSKGDDFVFIVEVDGKPVGQVAVYGVDCEQSFAEVGRFLVAPESEGNGYMTHACRELVHFSARELGLQYVFLEVFENNSRAISLYERLGFSSETSVGGILRMGMRIAAEAVGAAHA